MRTLRTKFIVWILLPTVGVILVTGLISFFVAGLIVLQQMKTVFAIGLRQAADGLSRNAMAGLQTLRILAAQERLMPTTDAQRERLLKEVKKDIPPSCVFMAFPDGRLVTTLEGRGLPPGFEARKQDWYRKAVTEEGPIVVPLRESEFTGDLAITIARKVVNDDGRLAAVIGFQTTIDTIREKMEGLDLLSQHKGIVLSVFTRDGTYVIHRDPSLPGRKIQEEGDKLHDRMWSAVKAGKHHWQDLAFIDGPAGPHFPAERQDCGGACV